MVLPHYQPLPPGMHAGGRHLVVALLAVLTPLVMIPANQSIQLMAPLGLLLAALVMASEVGAERVGQVARMGVIRPLPLLLLALLVWMAISLLWTAQPARALRVWAPLAGIAVAAIIGLPALRRIMPARTGLWLAFGLGVALVLLAVEGALDFPLRRMIGSDPQSFRLNRPQMAIAMLLWPALLVLVSEKLRFFAVVLVALALGVMATSQAGAALFGVLVGLMAWGLATWLPRLAGWLIAGTALVALAGAPWLMRIVNDVIPPALHDKLAQMSSHIRGDIWHAFALAIPMHPVGGFGLDATRVMHLLPEAVRVAEPLRGFLNVGHPHNAALQVWVELGAVGAVLTLVALALGLRGLLRLEGRVRSLALAAFSAGFAIAYVSHGAWQAWWIATLVLTFGWLAVAAQAEGGVALARGTE